MTAASDRAADELRTRILGGEYVPGERLAEAELAAALGVSRTPVREALRRLAADGLVEITTNKGARVVEHPHADLDAIFAIRAHVEGIAARTAADRVTDADLDRLDEIATELTRCSDAGQHEDVLRLNAQFHGLINGLSGSAVLTTAVNQLIHASVLFRTLQAFDEDARRRSCAHHHEIVAALRARDGAWAEAVMHAHLYSARASLLGPRTEEDPR